MHHHLTPESIRPEFIPGSVFTSTYGLSNDARKALFYAKWKGHQKVLHETLFPQGAPGPHLTSNLSDVSIQARSVFGMQQ